jgi:hypothetical protein
MRVKFTVVALLAVASAVVFAQQGQNPFVGRWNLRGTGPDTDKVYWLEVTQKGDQLEGRFLNRSAHATPLAWIRVEGKELVFRYGRGEGLPESPVVESGPIYRAHLENGKLIGHHVLEPSGRGAAAAPAGGANPPAPPAKEIRWVGTRQPTWPPSNANGNHSYGKPSVLVGPGVGLDVWTGATAEKSGGWKIENGILSNEPPTFNPISKEKFKDFKLETEFKLEEKQNSGLYLRGRYELQLALGPGNKLTHGRQGFLAIYGWKATDVDAAKPAGEWQSLEAIVVGNRLTATANGKRIHDNAILPAMTGGALDNDELAPGPIMIQGDHSHVSFRRMVVTPITKSGT